MESIAIVVGGWVVVDIVGGSSLFGGLVEMVVGTMWRRKCVVVWFECDGMFVGRMSLFVVVVRESVLKRRQIDEGRIKIVVVRERSMEYF